MYIFTINNCSTYILVTVFILCVQAFIIVNEKKSRNVSQTDKRLVYIYNIWLQALVVDASLGMPKLFLMYVLKVWLINYIYHHSWLIMRLLFNAK